MNNGIVDNKNFENEKKYFKNKKLKKKNLFVILLIPFPFISSSFLNSYNPVSLT